MGHELSKLALLWSVLYAWDKVLEELYAHFCWLEYRAIASGDISAASEVYVIRAHLQHYDDLLSNFEHSVKFIRDTHNPAMDADEITDAERFFDKQLLDGECANLLSEIANLQKNRHMQDNRFDNLKQFIYVSSNIEDSKAMKRLSYIAMIFLPATLMTGIFGMNVKEINPGTYGTVMHYAESTLLLTFVTVWIVMALRSRHRAILPRLLWPITLLYTVCSHWRSQDRSSYLPL